MRLINLCQSHLCLKTTLHHMLLHAITVALKVLKF